MSQKKKNNTPKQPKIVQINSVQNTTPAQFDPQTGAQTQPAKSTTIVFGLGADNKLYLWSHQQGAWLPNWMNEEDRKKLAGIMQNALPRSARRLANRNARKKKK
jgi:hypothetical protein